MFFQLTSLRVVLAATLASLSLGGCQQTVVEKRIYVPCNYYGWVNIIYEAKGGTSYSLITPSVNLYLLSGDLTRCLVPNKASEGYYIEKLFYICSDNLQEIPSFTSINSHVSRGYSSQIKFEGVWHPMYSFYLSKSKLERSLPDNALPPNPVDTIVYHNVP